MTMFIRRDRIIRSSQDIQNMYPNVNKKYLSPSAYYKNQPDTSSRRIDTYQSSDALIEDMTFRDKINLYKKMHKSCAVIQRCEEIVVGDCMNTFPLFDIIYDDVRINKDKDYKNIVLDVNRLIKKPSIETSRNDLMYHTYAELFNFGNSFWRKMYNKLNNKILFFTRLRPENIVIIPKLHKTKGVVEYYYLESMGYNTEGDLKYKLLQSRDVIHFKMPNICNPLYGASRLDALINMVYMDVQSLSYQTSFFKNAISPGTIINIEGQSDDNINYISEYLSQELKKNPYSPMIIPGKNVKMINKETISDLDFRELRNANTDDLYELMGVPLSVASRGKHQIQRQDTPYDNFIKHTISKYHKVVVDALNLQFIEQTYNEDGKHEELNISVTVGNQIVPGTKDAAEFVKLAMQCGPMAGNEIRNRLGLPLFESGGDIFWMYTPNGIVPIDYQYNFDLDPDNKHYELDDKGKPINPKYMFSDVEFKIDRSLYRFSKDTQDKIKNMSLTATYSTNNNKLSLNLDKILKTYKDRKIERNSNESKMNDIDILTRQLEEINIDIFDVV